MDICFQEVRSYNYDFPSLLVFARIFFPYLTVLISACVCSTITPPLSLISFQDLQRRHPLSELQPWKQTQKIPSFLMPDPQTPESASVEHLATRPTGQGDSFSRQALEWYPDFCFLSFTCQCPCFSFVDKGKEVQLTKTTWMLLLEPRALHCQREF